MTIDEAIKHCLDIADSQDKCAEISVSEHAKERISQCAADYRQLAEWLKELKEIESKHWDECRQIAHYDDELKEAKRLLKLALPLINSSRRIDAITNLSTGKKELLKHYILDESLKLIGGSENG